MFTAVFKIATVIETQEQLSAAFETDRIYLEHGARLTVEGRIKLGPGVIFSGRCSLGDETEVHTGSTLRDVVLGCKNNVRAHSILTSFEAGHSNVFGPFCFLRDGCVAGSNNILGAHVEAARSTFGTGVKISHRAFIGDGDLGDDVIIGAGVVFCNYDRGAHKTTTVGAGAMIGSGVLIVAPRRIGAGAEVGAGSVLTKDVAPAHRVIQKR